MMDQLSSWLWKYGVKVPHIKNQDAETRLDPCPDDLLLQSNFLSLKVP